MRVWSHRGSAPAPISLMTDNYNNIIFCIMFYSSSAGISMWNYLINMSSFLVILACRTYSVSDTRMVINKQTNIQIKKNQTDIQKDKQANTYKHTDRQTNKQTNKQTNENTLLTMECTHHMITITQPVLARDASNLHQCLTKALWDTKDGI